MKDRLEKIESLVATLCGPDGCPWDQEQSLADLRTYMLEEAHELAAAIDDGATTAIREELGDLLFLLVFISRLIEPPSRPEEAQDESQTLTEIIEALLAKMIGRHPHVFGDEPLEDSRAVNRAWEARKATEGSQSVLGGVPSTLPALLGAYRISQKAAGVGFDWPDVQGVLEKVQEELGEVIVAMSENSPKATEEEVGDLLFATANLARKLGFDPEAALQQANRKFKRRFEAMEARLTSDEQLSQKSIAEMQRLWDRAKNNE